jgi:hypothetical protein
LFEYSKQEIEKAQTEIREKEKEKQAEKKEEPAGGSKPTSLPWLASPPRPDPTYHFDLLLPRAGSSSVESCQALDPPPPLRRSR